MYYTISVPCPLPKMVNNGVCNKEVNIKECDFDGADCLGQECQHLWLMGDNFCAPDNNFADCNYDGGDCIWYNAGNSKLLHKILNLFWRIYIQGA